MIRHVIKYIIIEQTHSVQETFHKQVLSLVASIKDMGNSFEESNNDLLVLHSKNIVDAEVVITLYNAEDIRQKGF